MKSGAMAELDVALSRQAEMLAEVRAERDEALRRCDRLNVRFVACKHDLEAMTRQRDQLASRLSTMLSIELNKQIEHTSSRHSSPERIVRPLSARHQRPQKKLTKEEREKMVKRLVNESMERKAANVKDLEKKIYQPFEEKQRKKVLRTQEEKEANLKTLYDKQIQHRDMVRKQNAEKRKEELKRPDSARKPLSRNELDESVRRLSTSYQQRRSASYSH